MPLTTLLDPDRIALLAGPADRDRVLDEAARLLAGDAGDAGADAAVVAECLRQRERLGSTAIGHGVAIPHGRCAAWGAARAAFLRLDPPVDFDAGDGQPVDLVFAMAVPEHFTQQHLQLLSELAERFADAGWREALRAAPDAAALRRLLLDGAA
ncbi:MAG: PTS sugar transporter subunit IIA [Luteimonas sp.]